MDEKQNADTQKRFKQMQNGKKQATNKFKCWKNSLCGVKSPGPYRDGDNSIGGLI